ncbi:hypothetical protein HK098_002526 [Nowakowskiella sp. JEL0407]|nr:hypothetical protein HK098_002526 [Nowakowskiella sp. JEL0407]
MLSDKKLIDHFSRPFFMKTDVFDDIWLFDVVLSIFVVLVAAVCSVVFYGVLSGRTVLDGSVIDRNQIASLLITTAVIVLMGVIYFGFTIFGPRLSIILQVLAVSLLIYVGRLICVLQLLKSPSSDGTTENSDMELPVYSPPKSPDNTDIERAVSNTTSPTTTTSSATNAIKESLRRYKSQTQKHAVTFLTEPPVPDTKPITLGKGELDPPKETASSAGAKLQRQRSQIVGESGSSSSVFETSEKSGNSDEDKNETVVTKPSKRISTYLSYPPKAD